MRKKLQSGNYIERKMNNEPPIPSDGSPGKPQSKSDFDSGGLTAVPAEGAGALPKAESNPEPSVLDYVKSRLVLRHGVAPLRIPSGNKDEEKLWIPSPRSSAPKSPEAKPIPWFSLGALGVALFAQRLFEPPNPSAAVGTVFYVLALGLLLAAVLRDEWPLAPIAEGSNRRDPMTMRLIPFFLFAILLIPAFILLGGVEIWPGFTLPPFFGEWFHLQDNLFNWFNVLVWLAALAFFIWSFWIYTPAPGSLIQRARRFIAITKVRSLITPWAAFLVAAVLIVAFFRVYHIQQTPAEPFSDHAEKILDIYDVSQGQTHIFFPRNTGREAIQMYWTLLISWIFGTGLSFISLKIGTVLFGLITLPYLYLLGCEIANRRVGLLAVLMAGIGYWPNVISRIGLRFPLYPLFVAPLMLYLVRGLRTRNRNDFILAGIFLGLGLNGYSPYRIVPFLVLTAFILYVLHPQSKSIRKDAPVWLVIIGLASLIIFLPLLRYAVDNPDMFALRAFSRLGLQPDPSSAQPLPPSMLQVFISNTWNALRMFNWNDGVIWVNSLPNRPALDVVSGALFLIGIVLLVLRYFQKRHWLDLFLLLSIPILLLPSILSLAFPGENPALNRTAGAIIPAFLIIAMALDGLFTALVSDGRRRIMAYALTAALLVVSAAQNFDLVFRQFDQNFRNGAWNSSDMGMVIKHFGETYGETNTAWIVPFAFWVDTRLPGIWAGIPNKDFAIPPDHLNDTLQNASPKLFILKANLQDPSQNDQKSIDILQQFYPQGSLSLHHSSEPGHDFWIYLVTK